MLKATTFRMLSHHRCMSVISCFVHWAVFDHVCISSVGPQVANLAPALQQSMSLVVQGGHHMHHLLPAVLLEILGLAAAKLGMICLPICIQAGCFSAASTELWRAQCAAVKGFML